MAIEPSALAGTSATVCSIHPGDRVLVGLVGERVSQEVARRLRDELAGAFPGVTFVLMAGVSAVAVQRPVAAGGGE